MTHYFLAMGAQRVLNADQNQGISFVFGSDQAHATILRQEDLAQRNAIMDALLSLPSLRDAYQLLYLVAPRIFGTSIDASLFRARGIGLLLYDERRIDEAVAAQHIQRTHESGLSQSHQNSVVAELATLRAMYNEMEKTISQLRSDLATFHSLDSMHEQRGAVPLHATIVPSGPSLSQTNMGSGELPSYFANNPWLELLSKRGMGEQEPIAG